MASLSGLSGAPLQFNPDFFASSGVVKLVGSFQGNASSSPLQAQNRGSWFTVTRVAAGQFRVQLVGLFPNPAIVPVQSQGNGQPNGLLAEASAWVAYESVGASVTAVGGVASIICSKFDTTTNPYSFDIFLSSTTGASFTGYDPVASTLRIFFEIQYKVLATLP